MKIVLDFVTNSSENDYYDCDDDCDCRSNSGSLGGYYFVVSVRFSGNYKVYDYLSHDTSVRPGDTVTIRGNYGLERAFVVATSLKTERELPLPLYRYKYIL